VVIQAGEIIATTVHNGRRHDFRMYKESGVHVHRDTLIRADSGYQGLQKIHAHTILPVRGTKKRPLSTPDRAHNHMHSSKRIVVEHMIRRLKVFRILKETYRNRRRRYGLRLNLIASLVNHETRLRGRG
jgi:hypothetical protein